VEQTSAWEDPADVGSVLGGSGVEQDGAVVVHVLYDEGSLGDWIGLPALSRWDPHHDVVSDAVEVVHAFRVLSLVVLQNGHEPLFRQVVPIREVQLTSEHVLAEQHLCWRRSQDGMVTCSNGVGGVVECCLNLILQIWSNTKNVHHLEVHALADSVRLGVLSRDRLVLDRHRLQESLKFVACELWATVVNDLLRTRITAQLSALKADRGCRRSLATLHDNFQPAKLLLDCSQAIKDFDDRSQQVDVNHVKRSISV
jgi:hypothetical protein